MKINTKKWFFASLMVLLIPCWGGAQVSSPIHRVGKITIAIEDFKSKDSDVGKGISEMLAAAFSATDRFDIVARGEDLGEVLQEITIGKIITGHESIAVNLSRADYLITGRVIGFENSKGSSVSIPLPIFQPKFHSEKAHVKVTVHIIDVKTGKEKVITGEGEKSGSSAGVVGQNLSIGDEGFGGTLLGQATQIAIDSLVAQITNFLGTVVPPPPPPPLDNSSTSTTTPVDVLIGKKRNPKIMVIIPETYTRHSVPDPAAETQIIRLLTEQGFECLDQVQVREIRYTDQMKEILNGNDKEAQAIGLKNRADIVVVGEAFCEFVTQHDLHGLISCRAHVEARAIRTDTGSILCANDFEGSGLDVAEFVSAKEALANAGENYANYLIEQIKQKWNKEVTTALTIQVIVTKVDFEQLSQLEKSWKNKIEGVQRIDVRDYDETAKRGEVDVVFSGDAQGLADALVQSKYLKLIKFSTNRIDVEFKGDTNDPPASSDQQIPLPPKTQRITSLEEAVRVYKPSNVSLVKVKQNFDKYKNKNIEWTGTVMETKEDNCMVNVPDEGPFILYDMDTKKVSLSKNQTITVVGKITDKETTTTKTGIEKINPVVKALYVESK